MSLSQVKGRELVVCRINPDARCNAGRTNEGEKERIDPTTRLQRQKQHELRV